MPTVTTPLSKTGYGGIVFAMPGDNLSIKGDLVLEWIDKFQLGRMSSEICEGPFFMELKPCRE